MSGKELTATILFILFAFMLGWVCKPEKASDTRIEERIDTLWQIVHDTTFVAVERKIERFDTVLLASVDTLRDSVLVEVPIERQVWSGENYNITTEGYRVKLQEVDIRIPTIEHTITKTVAKRKHWGGSIGVQAGYGATIHGLSPYAGVGVNVGYNF